MLPILMFSQKHVHWIVETQKDYHMCERLVSPKQWQFKLDAKFQFGTSTSFNSEKHA